MSLRVKYKDGILVLLDPAPSGWCEGDEFEIERNGQTASDDPTELDDQYWRELEEAVAEIPEEDFQRMQAALDEHRREAKEWMRRRMGLD